jgi:ABC-type microcin C transport system duplicated ATPase subunit YejF
VFFETGSSCRICCFADLSAIKQLADPVALTFGGTNVKRGDSEEVVSHQRHDEVRRRLAAVPRRDPTRSGLGADAGRAGTAARLWCGQAIVASSVVGMPTSV